MKIRLVKPASLPELVRADARIFLPDDRWGERLEDYSTRPGAFVAAAVSENEKIVGYVLGWILARGTVLHIPKLGVEPAHRKRGIGRRLMKAAIAHATREHPQIGSVTLHVSTQNIPAYSLYNSLGFEAEELVKNYYGAPKKHAFKMRLRL